MGIRSVPKTDTGQTELRDAITDFLKSNIGQGAEGYGGQLVADIPGLFTEAYGEFAGGQFSTDINKAMKSMISGEPAYTFEPGAAAKRWQDIYATPVMKAWTDTVLPQVLEAQNVPGNLAGFSTPISRTALKATSDFYGGQVAPKLYDWLNLGEQLGARSKEEAAARVPGATQLPYQQFLQKAGASSMFQNLEQAPLTAAYQEFLRTRAEPGWAVQAGSGISTAETLDAFYKPKYKGGYAPTAMDYVGLASAAGGDAGITGEGGSGAAMTAMLAMLSDRNLKENILPINDALNKISKIPGVTFNFIGSNDTISGVIAQDVEKVMPEAVTVINGVKHVRLDSLIGLIIKAINELREKVI